MMEKSYKSKRNVSVLIVFLIFFFQIFLSNAPAIDSNRRGIDLEATSPTLKMEFLIESPSITADGSLNVIQVVVNYTATNTTVPYDDLTVHKFNIYNDVAGTQKVLSGDLVWNTAKSVWESMGITLLWTWGGKFYVTVECKTAAITASEETSIIDDSFHSYERSGIEEIIITAIILVCGIVGIAILIVVLKLKKADKSLERKTKDLSKEDIKISVIKKDELLKSKKEKVKEKKEKGKTEVKEDLIFSVPQWEVDDEDNE